MRERFPADLPRLMRFAPGAVLGVFVARVSGEAVGLPGAWAAVALSAILGASGAWLLARFSPAKTWPAVILLAYLIYPESDLAIAGRVAATALLTLALNWFYHNRPHPVAPQSTPNHPGDWLGAALLALLFFSLYLATLAPDVLAADSGELQVVAAQLGVAHPPGFPLYVLLAHLFTRLLPFVSPAYAVNLFSVVTSALTVAVVYLSAVKLAGRLPSLVAAVALGTAATFWSQATTANVRSLTGLFAVLILYVLIRFREATARGDRGSADCWLFLTALFMGFGLTHHVSLIFLIAVGLVFILVVDRSLIRAPRRWLWPVLAGLASLLPLLYLPLRAAAEVRGASPDLATWAGFLEHVLATGFRGDLFYYLAPAELWQRLLIIGNVLTFQFGTFVLLGMLLGVFALVRRDRPMALLLGGSFAAYALVAATYRAPQTVEYMMPAYVSAALLLAAAIGYLPSMVARFGLPGWAVATLITALVIVSAAGQAWSNRSAAGANHEAQSAREYAATLLDNAPADSVILAHWHWATPLWYLQEIEGARPDVAVRFVFPEGEAYEATWARRTADEFTAGRQVITTWVPIVPLPGLPVPEPIGDALLYPLAPRESLPGGFAPITFTLSEKIELVGYHVKPFPDDLLIPGDESVITVAWRHLVELPPEQKLFIHLVGQDGAIYGQDDRPAVAAKGITITQFRVTPRPGTPLGILTVAIGTSDGATEERHELTDLTVWFQADRSFTRNPVSRTAIDRGEQPFMLIGYDWDHTLEGRDRLYLHWAGDFLEGYWTQVVDDDAIAALDLPPYRGPWGVPVASWQFPRGRDGGHYVPFGEGIVWTGETFNGVALAPGEATVIDQEFHSARPINRDYVISVRLIGLETDGVHWAWWDLQDSIPAMGAIPTLKWIAGSFVRSPHRLTAATTATPGQTLTGALTIYDAFTNRPLPILDERMTAENPWVPLCQDVVEQ